ncbi:mannose 6-phosphate receptor domain-containing protein [Peniophora sp. CONT]|nr:mannose 6-phosphate receptor domain-containing protein [Peniophora sp. CONT]
MHRRLLSASVFILATISGAAAAEDTPECTVHDGRKFYDLRPLLNNRKDYTFQSPGGQEFHINVCKSVVYELWNAEVVNPDTVGAVTRRERGDFSIGAFNTTVEVLHGHPLITMMGGSPCSKGEGMSAMTAVRFICDTSVFGAGSPELVAQLPYEDEHACAFFLEWRTHHACPAARPGGFWSSLIAILGAILMIALIGYIVGMTTYNRFVLKKRGFDQLPRISIFSFTDTLDAASGLIDRCFSGKRAQAWRGDSRLYNHHHTTVAERDEEQAFAREEEEERDHDTAPVHQVGRDSHEELPQGMGSDGTIRL